MFPLDVTAPGHPWTLVLHLLP